MFVSLCGQGYRRTNGRILNKFGKSFASVFCFQSSIAVCIPPQKRKKKVKNWICLFLGAYNDYRANKRSNLKYFLAMSILPALFLEFNDCVHPPREREQNKKKVTLSKDGHSLMVSQGCMRELEERNRFVLVKSKLDFCFLKQLYNFAHKMKSSAKVSRFKLTKNPQVGMARPEQRSE